MRRPRKNTALAVKTSKTQLVEVKKYSGWYSTASNIPHEVPPANFKISQLVAIVAAISDCNGVPG
jgi:hypothetical protein